MRMFILLYALTMIIHREANFRGTIIVNSTPQKMEETLS